jgi:thioredoxin-related protein
MITTTLTAVLLVCGLNLCESAWDTNYGEALKRVRTYDRPLFIVFDTAESELGNAARSGVFMNDSVEQTLTDSFVRLFVDIGTEEGRILAADFAVYEYPRIVVIDRSGEWQVYRRSGFHTADEVHSLLGRFRRTKIISGGYSASSVSTTAWSVPSTSVNPTTSATLCKT